MSNRPLVGRLTTTIDGDLEFVPASTGAKYRTELVDVFRDISVITSVVAGEYLVINKWNWLGGGGPVPILVVDASSIQIASQNPGEERIVKSPDLNCRNIIKGKIVGISSFLKIKNESDHFNNSFCLHCENGVTLIFRGIDWIMYRQNFFSVGGSVVVEGFKKIKLGAVADNTTTYMSVESSKVVNFSHPIDDGEKLTCRIIRINEQIGSVWVSISKKSTPVMVSFNAWGKCDRRTLIVGAVFTVSNFHIFEDDHVPRMSLCPCQSSVTVTELPPIGTVPGIRIYNLIAENIRCLRHTNTDRATCGYGTKFSLHSLCKCDCWINCEQRKDDDVTKSYSTQRTDDVDSLFAICLRQSEICVKLLKLEKLLDFKAPPFFNVSVERVGIEVVGPSNSEVAKEFSLLPSSLRSSLFPPTKPFNSYSIGRLVQDKCIVNVLIPRDAVVSHDKWYTLEQVLIVNTDKSAHVHGVILKKDAVVARETRTVKTYKLESPAKKALQRQNVLKGRIQFLVKHSL
jgi:hypothetical protein